MNINSLEIQNFRCFESLSFELHPQVTVLIALNGGGKTTLLDAARVAVWPFVKAFDLGSQTGKSATIQIDDVRLKKQKAGNMESVIPSSITASGEWGNKEHTWKQWRENVRPRTNTLGDKETKSLKQFGEKLQDKVRRQESDVDLPLVIYLGTGRLWFQGRYTSVVSEKKLDNSVHSRLWGYQNCITAASSYKQFEDWYGWVYRSYYEQQVNKISADPVFDSDSLQQFEDAVHVIKSSINTVTEKITGWRDLQYSQSMNQQLVMTHPEHGVLPLSMLSDGMRNVVNMVADIAFRCIKLNPHLGREAALETKGVAMIDEVDMFLHPAWQQIIVSSLTKAFPNLQFVVTTHSPQVLTTVPSECIRVIDDGGVYAAPKGSKGAESWRVLERIFGVDSRPKFDENAQLLHDYKRLVYSDEWGTDQAIEMRKKLDEEFGGEEPDLTELDLYIENRKWEIDLEEDQ